MISAPQTLHSSGGTLELVPTPKKSHAGLPVELQAKAGVRYCLVDKQGKPVNTEKASRIGNDLVITLQDGMEVVLKDFFLAKKPLNGKASEDESATDDAPQWLQFEAGHLVTVIEGHSDNTLATGTLLSTEDIQAALKDVQLYTLDGTTASLLPIDTNTPVQLADASEQAGLPYLHERMSDLQLAQATAAEPIASATPEAVPASAGSFNALPYVGGLLGVLAIAGAGGGGGGAPVKPVENILLGNARAGYHPAGQ